MKKPTMSSIVAANKAAGGHYFDKDTLKFFGQKLSDFKVKMVGERVLLVAYTHREWNLKFEGKPASLAEFNPATGEIKCPDDELELRERFKR